MDRLGLVQSGLQAVKGALRGALFFGNDTMADMTDPAVVQALADLAVVNSKLTSGLIQIRENSREMRFDMSALRIRKAELETFLTKALAEAPRVRRVLTYTPSKGL